MSTNPAAVDTYREKLLPLRRQMTVRNAWLRERLETVIPEIMAREGLEMWLIIAREYNEDPVLMTLLPEPAMTARRRTMLVFARRNDGSVDRLALDRYGYPDFYEPAWNPDHEDQWDCLARLVRERNPARIGVDVSKTFAFGDGLSHSEHESLVAALGRDAARIESGGRLCVGWLERRIAPELAAYPGIVEIGHALIAEALSSRVIHPGITTTDDLVWWFRQTMHDLGLRAWFQPTVEIQAPGQRYDRGETVRTVILPGDLLHCDVGFFYLGLATDQQQHAYVLRPGESDAPEGLRMALADANRLQDIHLEAMRPGFTGNQVLATVLDRARSEGIHATVYSHPLGYHGHAAGPVIGLWDHQDGVPGRGDYPLYDETCYSIELNAKRPVSEWEGQEVRIALEEDAVLSGGQVRWLHGRQTAFHLVG